MSRQGIHIYDVKKKRTGCNVVHAVSRLLAIWVIFAAFLSPAYSAGTDNNVSLRVVAQPRDGGRVSGSGDYAPGSVVKIVATPQKDYMFSRWEGRVVHPSDPKTEVYVGYDPQQVIAVFDRVSHRVNANIHPPGGGAVEGLGFHPVGTQPSFIARPAPGYEFESWEGPVVDGNKNQTKLSTPISAPVLLTARFRPMITTHSLRIFAEPASGGKVSGAGSFKRGENIKISAEPSVGYTFAGWVGPVVSVANKETTVYISGDTDLQARFVPHRAIVVAKVYPEGAGKIAGDLDNCLVGVPVSIRAEPASGYVFIGWQGPVARPSSQETVFTPGKELRTIIIARFKAL